MTPRTGLALAVVASCAPGAKPAARAPATPSPAAAPAPPPAPSAAAPAPPPPPVHPAVLLPGRYDAMLFADERERLDAIARDKLAAQQVAPIALVPESELAALRALVASGRVREGGPKCAKPPSFERAVHLHYPDAWAAQAETACMGNECTLWLYVREPTGPVGWDHASEWPVHAEASANVQAVTDVAAFEAAMRGADIEAPAPAGDGEVGGIGGFGYGYGVGGRGPAHRHLVIDLEAAGPWQAPPGIKDLARDQRRFDACPATQSLEDEVLADIDASGKVDRCETDGPNCLCDVLRGHSFPPGPPLRRARVRFSASGGSGYGLGKLGGLGKRARRFFVLLRGYDVQLDDDTDVMDASAKQLEACFSPTAAPQRFDADVEMTVDEAGQVTAARVTKGHDAMTDHERACVTRWAAGLRFSCEPLDGTSTTTTLRALLTVSR